MSVTFTNFPLKLQFSRENIEPVLSEIDKLIVNNPNKIYTVDTSVHVASVEAADNAIEALDRLRELGAIDQYKHEDALNQIDSFKKLYLR